MSTFSTTSPVVGGIGAPTGGLEIPSEFDPYKGFIVDLVGNTGLRLTFQLGSELGGFSTSSGQTYRLSEIDLLTEADLIALGGLAEVAVRVTLFDGDTGPTEFARNSMFLTLAGVEIGSFTGIDTQILVGGSDNFSGGAMSSSFGNGRTELGWFYQDDPASLATLDAALFAAVSAGMAPELGFLSTRFGNYLLFEGSAPSLAWREETALPPGPSTPDTITTGAGNDTLDSGLGNDVVTTGLGTDFVVASGGNDIVNLGGGNDTAFGGIGADTLTGGQGDDYIDGGAAGDLILGQGGDDTLFGGDGGDTVQGGTGDDTLNGGIGTDMLHGGSGNDTLFGGNASDVLRGDAGQDLLDGGTNDDTLAGGGNGDTLRGGSGNDTLRGESGADSLDGGQGDDELFGGLSADLLIGGVGNDILRGAAGVDTLFGGDGNDSLSGGTERDTLSGGAGNDTVSGGAGADRFLFGVGDDFDRINGFEQGVDRIVLSQSLWSTPHDRAAVMADYGSISASGLVYTLSFDGGEVLEIQSGTAFDLMQLELDLLTTA